MLADFLKKCFRGRNMLQSASSMISFKTTCHTQKKNVLRGMHYDLRMAKLVQTLQGAIYDVVVDMRQDSKFYKKWFGCRLTAENHWQLYVPAGFAHGFLTLSDEALVMYKQSATYAPEHERLLRWDDPTVAIEWLLGATPAVLSAKDAAGP